MSRWDDGVHISCRTTPKLGSSRKEDAERSPRRTASDLTSASRSPTATPSITVSLNTDFTMSIGWESIQGEMRDVASEGMKLHRFLDLIADITAVPSDIIGLNMPKPTAHRTPFTTPRPIPVIMLRTKRPRPIFPPTFSRLQAQPCGTLLRKNNTYPHNL